MSPIHVGGPLLRVEDKEMHMAGRNSKQNRWLEEKKRCVTAATLMNKCSDAWKNGTKG